VRKLTSNLVLSVGPERPRSRPFDLLQNRHGRFRDGDGFRRPFELVVQRAIAEGLAVDASLITADANKQRSAASTISWIGRAGDGTALRSGISR
jgi:hypothetical protein